MDDEEDGPKRQYSTRVKEHRTFDPRATAAGRDDMMPRIGENGRRERPEAEDASIP